MSHSYTVPIIPQNLNKQETVVQVAEVLNHLANVTDDILLCISKRVELNRTKMLNISQRIAKVDLKINKLTGAKKATQVFSSCKYPAKDVNQQYISIFSDANHVKLERHQVKITKANFSDEPLDKLHVYHVNTNRTNEREVLHGLGEIPTNLECVNDLLLYNSGKNLYKNFVISDALQGSHQVKEQENLDGSVLGAAPHSISDRTMLTRSSTQTYFYTPNLGEVPALDVPLDLPDLPGIADDLRYNTELGPGIAPSVTTTPSMPDLPSVTEEQTHNEPSVSVPADIPPPPPLIELIKVEPEPVIESRKPERETMSSPLLPEPQPHTVAVSKNQEKENIPKLPELPQIDVHANLMEAIRKAGGSRNAKLKKSAVTTDEPSKTMGGNDLMSDLHAKLSLRRKGISGAKKQEMDAGSTMERISAMIPPPIVNSESNTTTEDDGDWED